MKACLDNLNVKPNFRIGKRYPGRKIKPFFTLQEIENMPCGH